MSGRLSSQPKLNTSYFLSICECAVRYFHPSSDSVQFQLRNPLNVEFNFAKKKKKKLSSVFFHLQFKVKLTFIFFTFALSKHTGDSVCL